MRKFLKLAALAVAILFVSVQFVRPNKTNPPVVQAQTIEAHVRVAPEVVSIFERACKDCHSNQTDWPWYAQVAPVSWYVADHVNHGRKHLNFSVWSNYDREQAGWLLGAICMTAERGRMPLPSYTRLHHSAKLSPLDVQTLCAWSQAEQRRIKG
ncbi:MAG TPA: heme-binding domain-containing protein [Pyrinomonadaceae bacterium]|nr:heme-binding domain-containing protein [Pyrinomonadaceae bacterium]